MALEILFKPGGDRVETTIPDLAPDSIPDEDAIVLRRVVINIMRGPLGLTNAQVRAAFAAAKRQTD